MPRISSIARLQRAITFLVIATGAGWIALWWSQSPAIAIAGALFLVLAHAWILGIELLLLPWVSRHDPTPRARTTELLRAWLAEIVIDLRVFGWRQPFRWRALPDRLEGQGVHGRTGVVLIHGFACNRGFWMPWMVRLQADGRAYLAWNLEPAFADIEHYLPQVQAAVCRVQQATGRPPVLVCHSMGGLVARAWLQKAGNAQRVAHVITLATPHRGTWLARFSRLPSGLQMQPGSQWLEALATALVPALAQKFTCWFSNTDNVVMPASTATLHGADNRLLRGAAHVDLAFRRPVMDACLERIAACDPPAAAEGRPFRAAYRA